MVHLGRNPITTKGWEDFKNLFIDEDAATGAGQGKTCIMRKSNYMRLIFAFYSLSVPYITKILNHNLLSRRRSSNSFVIEFTHRQ